MTHTALTADGEIRRLRGLATARKEHPVFGDRREYPIPVFGEDQSAGRSPLDLPVLLLESSARRALAELLACRDVLPPAPPRPTLVARVQARLAALIRRLGRPLGNVVAARTVTAADPSVAK